MFRADAVATVRCVHPIRKRWRTTARRLPILMYHSVAETDHGPKHPYYSTVTRPDIFRDQMQLLHDEGYQAVTLDEAIAWMQAGTETKKPVVITFDDGFRDFYTTAFPILAQYGFRASMFLPTSYIGTASRSFTGIECMTWEEVRELHRRGIEFGSHTATHPKLAQMAYSDIEYELRNSKETIETQLGEAITSFAYPYAFPETHHEFRARFRTLLEQTGYRYGVSTIIGTAHRREDQFFLPRLPVNSYDDPGLFRAKLDGAYDWMHTLQYAFKMCRTALSRPRKAVKPNI